MSLYDNEENIIEEFQETFKKEILVLPKDSTDAKNICESILEGEQWAKWVNNSGKNALPPDFYCDEYKLMMDVMRVDDHGFISEKGKCVNKTYEKENQVEKE